MRFPVGRGGFSAGSNLISLWRESVYNRFLKRCALGRRDVLMETSGLFCVVEDSWLQEPEATRRTRRVANGSRAAATRRSYRVRFFAKRQEQSSRIKETEGRTTKGGRHGRRLTGRRAKWNWWRRRRVSGLLSGRWRRSTWNRGALKR